MNTARNHDDSQQSLDDGDHDDSGLPSGLLLAYYGDDFTGSTDVMEAFTAAGVPTVLFLQPPSADWLARFPDVRCVGVAGLSRGRDPAWMREHLPSVFSALAALDPPILQYKVCSTFDSSPTIGSIGCAIDLGVPRMHGDWSPMLVGAPRLKRYQAFGNLFADSGGQVYRLDRHPTMSRHPVTPMAEANLGRHLAHQTSRRIDLIDLGSLQAGTEQTRLDHLRGPDVPVVSIDVLDQATLLAAGRLVWRQRGAGLFSASSSGLQYALVAYWRSRGWLPTDAALPAAGKVASIAVISGSCSPVTARQIQAAANDGFCLIRLDLGPLLDPTRRADEIDRTVERAVCALADQRSPLVYSAAGPDDPAVTGFERTAATAVMSRGDAALAVGRGLAQVMARLLDRTSLQRVVVAGGDSSGEVVSELNVVALRVIAGVAPGAPLCRVSSSQPSRDGLEIVLKGGQMGGDDFFSRVRDGSLPAA